MSAGRDPVPGEAALRPVTPDWPAPATVRAYSTTRRGGVSPSPFESLNLGFSGGDDPENVRENRTRVATALGFPGEPLWLRQVHGTRVVDAAGAAPRVRADAAVTRQPGRVLVVMTADCVPVLLCDRSGRQVAAAHAGWRGLAAGVLEAAVNAFDAPPAEVLAWLGPGIGPAAFEVGPEVREAFLERDAGAGVGFRRGRGDRWLADLCLLARRRLARAGVDQVYGGGFCTVEDAGRFFSYRRDGARSGRMGTFIWIDS